MSIILPFLKILANPCFLSISIFIFDFSLEDESIGDKINSLVLMSKLEILSTTSDTESFFTILFEIGEYVLPILANNSFK